MDINKFNKKRVLVNILSLVITIILLMFFIFSEVVISSLNEPLIMLVLAILSFALFATCLYLLAKFIIIPKYEKLKMELANYVFNQRYKNIKINTCKPNNLIEYLYNKNTVNINNSFQIIKDNMIINTFDYSNVRKKHNKGPVKDFYGKYVCFTINGLNAPRMAFISQNKDKSETFNNFFTKKYKNINNDVSSLKKFNRYTGLYDDKLDIKYLSLLEDISLFNTIIIEENKITIFYHEKNDGYEFNLTKKVSNDIVFRCKDSYSSLFRIIDLIERS